MTSEHTRPLALAAQVTKHSHADLEEVLEAHTVALSLDAELPGACETADALIDTLRRSPGTLLIETDATDARTVDQLIATANGIDPTRGAHAGRARDDAVSLHVGMRPRRTDAICVVPDGHGAHLGRRVAGLRQTHPPTRLGILTASSLAAGEVFKLAASVRPDRRIDHELLSFCPVTLSSRPSGADVSTGGAVDLALIGLGAVGSAIAVILGGLDLEGRVVLVDCERFAPENLGTYSLGAAADRATRPRKIDLAAAVMRRFDIERYYGRVQDVPGLIDSGDLAWPPTVLTALDSVRARHAAQRIWPNRLIDGGTGDTMAGMHDVSTYKPCLMCFLPGRNDGRSSIEILSEITELPPRRLGQGDELLEDADLLSLSAEKQRLLRPYVGKPICGLADAFGLSSIGSRGYQPAIPFVSQQAAVLVVGRLIAHLTGMSPRANLVQFDSLIGPANGTYDQAYGDPACYCAERTSTIDTVRRKRDLNSVN
jgi:hypothetical protein